MNNISYKDRCEQCDLIPLSYLREQYDLIFLYNYLHDKFSLVEESLFKVDIRCRQTRLADAHLLLHIPRVHTNVMTEWYTIRVCYLWNKLCNNI